MIELVHRAKKINEQLTEVQYVVDKRGDEIYALKTESAQ